MSSRGTYYKPAQRAAQCHRVQKRVRPSSRQAGTRRYLPSDSGSNTASDACGPHVPSIPSALSTSSAPRLPPPSSTISSPSSSNPGHTKHRAPSHRRSGSGSGAVGVCGGAVLASESPVDELVAVLSCVGAADTPSRRGCRGGDKQGCGAFRRVNTECRKRTEDPCADCLGWYETRCVVISMLGSERSHMRSACFRRSWRALRVARRETEYTVCA